MPDKSTDIESDNIIKRYQRRPRQLQNICLADFVAWFNCVKDSQSAQVISQKDIVAESELPKTNFVDNVDDDPSHEVINEIDGLEFPLRGGMKIVKRKKPRIIRSVRFNKEKDPENYYREQLMLYTSWRNEQKDLMNGCQTYQQRYNQLEEIAATNKKQYECHTDILDKAIDDINDDNITQPVAPNVQHLNEQDLATKTKPSKLFGCFDPGTNKQHSQYDLYYDIGILPRSNDDEKLVQKRLLDSDFRQLLCSLNIKQREFFYNVLHSIKTKKRSSSFIFKWRSWSWEEYCYKCPI